MILSVNLYQVLSVYLHVVCCLTLGAYMLIISVFNGYCMSEQNSLWKKLTVAAQESYTVAYGLYKVFIDWWGNYSRSVQYAVWSQYFINLRVYYMTLKYAQTGCRLNIENLLTTHGQTKSVKFEVVSWFILNRRQSISHQLHDVMRFETSDVSIFAIWIASSHTLDMKCSLFDDK